MEREQDLQDLILNLNQIIGRYSLSSGREQNLSLTKVKMATCTRWTRTVTGKSACCSMKFWKLWTQMILIERGQNLGKWNCVLLFNRIYNTYFFNHSRSSPLQFFHLFFNILIFHLRILCLPTCLYLLLTEILPTGIFFPWNFHCCRGLYCAKCYGDGLHPASLSTWIWRWIIFKIQNIYPSSNGENL